MSGTLSDAAARRPEDAVLRGGGLPAAAVGGLVTAGSVPFGADAVAGAAVGVLLTVGTFALGPAVLRTSSRWSPPAVMVVAVSTYALSVVLLAVAFILLRGASWLSPVAVGVAIFACATAWMVGHIRAAGRLRVLVFGGADEAPDGHDVAGHDGSGPSSGPPSH